MKFDEVSKKRKRLYWRVDWKDDYRVKATYDSAKASNFYLMPIVRRISGEKHFHIATDPEDVPIEEKTVTVPTLEMPVTDIEGVLSDEETTVTGSEDVPSTEVYGNMAAEEVPELYEPKRYIAIIKNSDQSEELRAEFASKKNRGSTSFKLKNVEDNLTYPLSKSQWLPEASLGSQPYIICGEGRSFRWPRGTNSVYVSKKCECNVEKCVECNKNNCKDNLKKCGYDDGRIVYKGNEISQQGACVNRLFILEKGHPT